MKTRSVHVLAMVATLLCACASRNAILTRTVAGLDAARASFSVQEDKAWQRQIMIGAIDGAPDRATAEAEAVAKLDAFRAARDKVLVAIEVAYAAVFAASLDASDINMERLLAASAAVFALYQDMRSVLK